MNTIDVRLQLFKVSIFVNAKVASEIVITYIHHITFKIVIICTSKNQYCQKRQICVYYDDSNIHCCDVVRRKLIVSTADCC